MTDNKTETHINRELEQQLQRLLSQLQLDDAPAGGAVVVYQSGKCIAQASIGMAQRHSAWQPDTLALNFSTGKGVLATLVHVLVSEQLLDYDTPIASYWPEFAANQKSAVTLRQLMSHQANLFAISSIDADSDTLLNWSQMLTKVAAMAITEPAESSAYQSAYSALVYGWIMGGLVEVVTKMSLAEALKYYLTEPLGVAESCYFGVPADKVTQVAQLAKDFEPAEQDGSQLRHKRHKPVLKPESEATLAVYKQLPSYDCWQQFAAAHKLAPTNASLTATQINRLYFNHSAINASNYRAALVPANKQPIDYHNEQALQAIIPAANGVASATALATIYAMLANGGTWQGKTLIDEATFAQLSEIQVTGMDAVMPAEMQWRLGYHRLFSICQSRNGADSNNGSETSGGVEQGFGHMGYNGSVAWCEPTRQLSFAFIHNFDATMLNDIRQFALSEAVIDILDKHR